MLQICITTGTAIRCTIPCIYIESESAGRKYSPPAAIVAATVSDRADSISKPSLSCTELHRLVHSHRLNRKVPSIAVLHRPVIQLVVLCSVASACQALCSLCSLICTGLNRPTMLVKYLQIYHAGHYLQIYRAHTQ